MRRSYSIPSGLVSKDSPSADARWPKVEALRKAIDTIAEQPSRLGLDGLDRDDGAELDTTIDTESLASARLYALLCRKPPAALAEAGAQGRRIEGLLDRVQEIGAVKQAAEQLDADLADTDRFAGLEEQALQEELSGVLHGLLSGQVGGLGAEERESLRGAAAEFLGLEEKERVRRSSAQREAREAAATHAAAINDAVEKERLADVMLELRHERPVDDAALDEALRTFSALQGP